MATPFRSLIARALPAAPESTSTSEIISNTSALFPAESYTTEEVSEINKWVEAAETASSTPAALPAFIDDLNDHLASRTTILGTKPSVADAAVYSATAPVVSKWDGEERTGEEKGRHHVVRHVDLVQNATQLFGSLNIPAEEVVKIDLDDVKSLPKAAGQQQQGQELPVRGKGADAAAASAQGNTKAQKKEKKPKQPKQPAAPAVRPSPSIIDLRVGHILRAVNHPNADSLYVSTINCGDAPGTENTSVDEETGLTVRTVCSGLNGLVPLAEMQGRKIVAVCNLKPVTMRGIKSCAMVLAASPKAAPGEDDHHAEPVELVSPPADANAGARVYFEGWKEGEPEKTLNPKKKVWETYQPGFTTTDDLEVAFDPKEVPAVKDEEAAKEGKLGKLVVEGGAVCSVKTLKGAAVK